MKNVILAKTAGFCFGVRRAVDMAYGIAGRDKVYTYGPIIHNETVVEDLEAKGVKVVHSIEEAAALDLILWMPHVLLLRKSITLSRNTANRDMALLL